MIVSPSLLSADFRNLARDVEMVNSSSADWLHIDVMDGVFVPNISFGFPVLDAIVPVCRKPLDVHLMIVEPEKWIGRVRDTGASIMNIHAEACRHLHSAVSQIKNAGMRAAVTLNPATPVVMLEDILEDLDMVLLMSVNPGFGGQKFIRNTLKKIARLRAMIDRLPEERRPIIEIDGGINASTAQLVAEAGADAVVAGNFVFTAENPLEAISQLKEIIAPR